MYLYFKLSQFNSWLRKDRIISVLLSAFLALYHNLQPQIPTPGTDANFGDKVLNTISLLPTFHSVPFGTSVAEGMLGGTELFSAFQAVVSGNGRACWSTFVWGGRVPVAGGTELFADFPVVGMGRGFGGGRAVAVGGAELFLDFHVVV